MNFLISHRGEIGRRERLKISFPLGNTGSIPVGGIMITKITKGWYNSNHSFTRMEEDFFEPTAKEKYDYNYERIFKVKQHVITIRGFKIIMWGDGEIIVDGGGQLNRIEDFLYIIQEYQEAFNGIKLKVDTSEWKGWEGKKE
jgi:hypothetical protein